MLESAQDLEALLFERVAGFGSSAVTALRRWINSPIRPSSSNFRSASARRRALEAEAASSPAELSWGEQVGARLAAELAEFGFVGAELELRFQGLLLEFQVREHEQHGVGLHRGPRQHPPFFDPSAGLGGQPADFLGGHLEAARAAHPADEFAALDRAGPDRGAADLGNGGRDVPEHDPDEDHRRGRAAEHQEAAGAPPPVSVGDLEIHGSAPVSRR